jgi:hypothetical protein
LVFGTSSTFTGNDTALTGVEQRYGSQAEVLAYWEDLIDKHSKSCCQFERIGSSIRQI